MLEFQFLKQMSSLVVEMSQNDWIPPHAGIYRRFSGKNRHLANFVCINARVPVFEAKDFFCGWNELRMIEYSLKPVNPADSAVKTDI